MVTLCLGYAMHLLQKDDLSTLHLHPALILSLISRRFIVIGRVMIAKLNWQLHHLLNTKNVDAWTHIAGYVCVAPWRQKFHTCSEYQWGCALRTYARIDGLGLGRCSCTGLCNICYLPETAIRSHRRALKQFKNEPLWLGLFVLTQLWNWRWYGAVTPSKLSLLSVSLCRYWPGYSTDYACKRSASTTSTSLRGMQTQAPEFSYDDSGVPWIVVYLSVSLSVSQWHGTPILIFNSLRTVCMLSRPQV